MASASASRTDGWGATAALRLTHHWGTSVAGQGRKPKPTSLRLLQGNAGKRPINLSEPLPAGDLFEPPAHLTESQSLDWTYAIANAPAGLLTMLDRDVLAIWVIARGIHRQCNETLAREDLLLKSKEGGTPYQHPCLAILNRQAEIMMKAGAEMGFTPSSRSRISVGEPGAGNVGAGNKVSPWAEFG
jgi:P27 family predicted phage terminase small subunit